MGYFKNQLIAQQVELGDRVPKPKPASEHVSLQEVNVPKSVPVWVVQVVSAGAWFIGGLFIGLAVSL